MAAVIGALAAANIVWAPFPGSQTLFMQSPIFETLYGGTRGPGKSDALLMDFAQHVGKGYGRYWRGGVFRKHFPDLRELIEKSLRVFTRIFPGATYNAQEHTWRFPQGESLIFGHIEREADYWTNWHGHELPWIGWDELGTYADANVYELMKSCCRSSHPGMPRKYRATANPYGVGHNWIKLRFVDPAPVGTPIRDSHGNLRVYVHGHWSENKALTLNDPDYIKRIASDRNTQRRKAWLDGSWDVVAGGMFDDVWNRDVHVLKPFPVPSSWRIDRAYDHGSSKPFAVGWWAESDGTPTQSGRVFPRGSLLRIGEWYGWDGEHPNEGLRMIDVDIAKGIREREQRAKLTVKAGPADAAIFYAEPGHTPLAATFEREKVPFVPSDKKPGSRKTGWEAMRRLLAEAAKPNPEAPGLWVFDTCTQFIRTVPVIPRDERDPDDVDTDAEDHIADETRYRCTAIKVSPPQLFKHRV